MSDLEQAYPKADIPPEIKSALQIFLKGLPDNAPWNQLPIYLIHLIDNEIRDRSRFCIFCTEDSDLLSQIKYFNAFEAKRQVFRGFLDDRWIVGSFEDHVCEKCNIQYRISELYAEKDERKKQADIQIKKSQRVWKQVEEKEFLTWLLYRGRKGIFSVEASRQFIAAAEVEGLFADLENIPYRAFLQSDYWFVVSSVKKYLSGDICAHCGTYKNLRVHHKTYEHRGQEHTHMDDLVVLCISCHSREHGRLKREAKSVKSSI